MTELMENIWIEWVESQAISNQMAIEVRLRPSPEKKKKSQSKYEPMADGVGVDQPSPASIWPTFQP